MAGSLALIKKMKTPIILLFSIFFSIVSNAQSIITEPFNQEKWFNSAEYRYDLILRSSDIIYEATFGKNEKEIIELLGEPISKLIRENSSVHIKEKGWTKVDTVIDLTYCLDNIKIITKDTVTQKKCLGSSITYHFYKNYIVDATITNIEPATNKENK